MLFLQKFKFVQVAAPVQFWSIVLINVIEIIWEKK